MAKKKDEPERIDLDKLDADALAELNRISIGITFDALLFGQAAENIKYGGPVKWIHWRKGVGSFLQSLESVVDITTKDNNVTTGGLNNKSGIILEIFKDKADALRPHHSMMRLAPISKADFIKLCEPFEAKERAENRRLWRQKKDELRKKRDDERQPIIAAEKERDEAQRALQELERQNKIQSYPLMTHVDAFLKRLDELPAEEVKGDKEQKLVALYRKLKQVLESNGQLSLEERELLGDHYLQGAEFDAVLKLWNDKIAKAKADTTLDEQQRKLTVGHLMAMMNKALQRLQEE